MKQKFLESFPVIGSVNVLLIASSHSDCQLSLLLRNMMTHHRRQANEPRETMVSASVRWNTRNCMLVRELVCTCCPAFLWAVISTSRLRLPPTANCFKG